MGNETELNKIIEFNYRNALKGKGVEYMVHVDANFNCFASDSMDYFLPYSIIRDDQAWSISQLDLTTRAFVEEPFAFKVYNEIILRNPSHNNEYPRNLTTAVAEHGKWFLSEGYSEGCSPWGLRHLQSNRVGSKSKEVNCSLYGNLLFTYSFNRTNVLTY